MPELLAYAEYMDGRLLVEVLGLALLHSLWQGVLIGLLFKVVMAALANASSALRYWCGVSALLLLALSVPSTMVYLIAGMLPGDASAETFTTGADTLVASVAGTAAEGFAVEVVVALWLAGVTLISIRTLAAWRHLRGLRQAADRLAARALVPVVERLSGLFGLAGRIEIGLSASINNPMVVGWLKPVILMPPAILARLPLAQLEMLIAHELAHLRRHDHWINLFQVVTETLMFYHPVVAMISRQIRVDREHACDDLAVTATRRRLDYVEMLASLEKTRGPERALALGIQDGQVLPRIRRLVELHEPRAGRGTAVPALIALLSVSALLAMSLIDEVISGHQTAEPGAIEVAGAGDESTDNAREFSAPVPLATAGPGAAPLKIFAAVETQADDAAPSLAGAGEIPRSAVIEDQKASGEPSVATSPDRATRPDVSISDPSSSSERKSPSDVQSAPLETSTVEQKPERTPTASDEPASSSGQSGESAGRPDTTAPEQVSNAEQVEAPRLDLSTLLALRAENRVASQTERPEPDALIGPEKVRPEPARPEPAQPERARPVAGDAQRPTKLVLAGGDPLKKTDPAYPHKALRREISGRVKVEFQVGRTGRVVGIEILDEMPERAGFGAAARDAIRQWKFEPFTHDGTPVVHRKTVVFNFEPGDGCRPVTGSKLLKC